jgi:hypothetical protein
MSRVTEHVRETVLDRADQMCERCGKYLDPFFYSLQHRRARGMGSSRRPDTNSPANLIALCGSATTPGGCHQWVESHPDEARAEGMRIGQRENPLEVPVKLWYGWVSLDALGNATRLEKDPV